MLTTNRSLQGILIVAFVGVSVPAQQALQFKANVRIKDGSDGSTSTGTMYFGGMKMRTELTRDGQNIVLLVDPRAKSQVILMPSEKVYMQMPIGQGPVSVPVTGPADPTNPCAGGSGNTDCVGGENETVNGYATLRWDYTSSEGVRTRAWVSTKLRFPVKVQDDNGSSTEYTNIAEGPQPASLFGIPSGYTKMDVGAMGGLGRGNRSSSSDPMAAAMANVPPDLAAAMAGAMREQNSRDAAPTGSGWEKTKGWVINLTIKGTAASNRTGEFGTFKESDTVTVSISIPLNLGSPSAGVPGAPGPSWQLMQFGALGSKEALATPITFNVDLKGRIERSFQGRCLIGEEPYTGFALVKASTQKRVSMADAATEMGQAQALFKISNDLKSYDLFAEIAASDIKETQEGHNDAKSCKDGRLHKVDETTSSTSGYDVAIDFKGLPMPSAVGPVSGSKKKPMKLGGRDMDATVNWTISPIR